jgi:competence protein ComEC
VRAVAIAFLGGILVVQQLPDVPSLWWGLALFPVAVLTLWHPRWVVPALFVAGFVYAAWRADLLLQQQLPTDFEGRDVVVEGVVADLPEPAEYGVRFLFDIERAHVEEQTVSVPRRVSLSASLDVAPRAGDRYRFTVRLKRPHGLQNPGGFDYEGYLFRNGIRATGYVRNRPSPVWLEQAGGRYQIDRWRERLGDRIENLLPGNANAGLVVALANGDTGGIRDAQWSVLQRTGTLHLVAISGMHITLIAGIVYFLVRWLWSIPGVTVLRWPAPLVGAAAGLVAASCYAALAGFVIPTQRALVMLFVSMGAVFLRRRVPVTHILAIALLAVLLLDPLAVMAPGFWLSYAAVAVIVYVMYDETPEPWWRKIGYLQLAITIGMAPLMLWLFQQFSLVSPIANLFAVPVFDLLAVPLTLLGALAIGLDLNGVAQILLQSAAQLLAWLWHVLDYLSRADYAQWSQHRPPLWTLVCGVVGVLLLLAPRGWPARTVGIVWVLPMFIIRPAGPAPGEFWFTLLDVGQGLAAVLRTSSHVMVYDTGPRRSARFDTGAAVVVPYLRSAGIRAIDMLIVSHGDNDHAGGAASIQRALPVKRVLTGTSKIAGDVCRVGETWEWEGVRFVVLSPDEPTETNNGSCVLRVIGPHGVLLLPGDIEKKAEQHLLDRVHGVLTTDILVAPHHGSRTSSTPAFVEAVRPRYVVFPVGYRNSYRHPHPLVVERYTTLGSTMYDSPSHGALEFRLTSMGISVMSYREQHRRYWFAR